MAVVIRNKSRHTQVLADLNMDWGAAGSGNDVKTVTDRQFRSSAHLQSMLIEGLMEKVDPTVAGQLLVDRRRALREETLGTEVTLEDDTQTELVSHQCMGVSHNGAQCEMQLFIANDGTEYPLCIEHEDQKNRCKWDRTLKVWLPNIKREAKLPAKELETNSDRSSAADMSIEGYQTVIGEDGHEIRPAPKPRARKKAKEPVD